ncbi:secretion-regulating guanine nucleotide exchange factor-like [Actinia tenebrosa]|uniref:Secretion-regulating guanine nucleotide exchange factor-like n=1 Tax=Actinia tenebrosa TaxID=6105 RepID=A0A6P8GYQ4_ACTTE|nr:secretion-regulating guanine nucleotide exchange factor-like [Actinia tenebrosa]
MADNRDNNITLLSWGSNSYGQLCNGHKHDVLYPEQSIPSPTRNVLALTGGGGHTALVSGDGKLYVCGWNNKGQLGLGDTVDRATLTHVLGIQAVRHVACGWNHTLVITDEGCLFVFGSNAFGQLGLGACEGNISSPCQVSLGSKVTDVAAGLRHSLVLLDDSSVWSWGDNKRGQLGIPRSKTKTVGTPTKVAILSDKACQVAAGSHHSVVLTENGQVFCWGSNQHGQCGKPVNTETKGHHHNFYDTPQLVCGDLRNNKVKSILSGWSHVLATTDDNQIYSWGRADYGQLGLGDEIVNVGYSWQPSRIPDLSGVKQLVCGAEHNIALLDSGEVLTWGWNEHSICGFKDEHNLHTPTTLSAVGESRKVRLVGCGGGHTFLVISQQ